MLAELHTIVLTNNEVRGASRRRADFLRESLQDSVHGVNFDTSRKYPACYVPRAGWDAFMIRHWSGKALIWQIGIAAFHVWMLSVFSTPSRPFVQQDSGSSWFANFGRRQFYQTCFIIPGELEISYPICGYTPVQQAHVSTVESWVSTSFEVTTYPDPDAFLFWWALPMDVGFVRESMILLFHSESCTQAVMKMLDIHLESPWPEKYPSYNTKLQFDGLGWFSQRQVNLTEAQRVVEKSCLQGCEQRKQFICQSICHAVSTHVEEKPCRRDENKVEDGGGVVVAYKHI